MTETKTTCDICGKIIPPFIYVSKFTIPYQTMELHLHDGDKYSCDFCTQCAERFADYIEKMKDIHKKEVKKIGSISANDITDAVVKGEEILFDPIRDQDIYEKNHITKEE